MALMQNPRKRHWQAVKRLQEHGLADHLGSFYSQEDVSVPLALVIVRINRVLWTNVRCYNLFLALSSLLAGAENGEEEGLSYDDLWMLSNIIGPARPITTTQEAIDSAGFHVGQFENSTQGMRGYDMLGDGSKCLVCMSDYEEGEDMRALRCRHGFHQECIDKVRLCFLSLVVMACSFPRYKTRVLTIEWIWSVLTLCYYGGWGSV